MARPFQISTLPGVISAKAMAAARAVAAAISHFDFQIIDAMNFKTLPASGAVLGS
jgi:hypothetical protein